MAGCTKQNLCGTGGKFSLITPRQVTHHTEIAFPLFWCHRLQSFGVNFPSHELSTSCSSCQELFQHGLSMHIFLGYSHRCVPSLPPSQYHMLWERATKELHSAVMAIIEIIGFMLSAHKKEMWSEFQKLPTSHETQQMCTHSETAQRSELLQF